MESSHELTSSKGYTQREIDEIPKVSYKCTEYPSQRTENRYSDNISGGYRGTHFEITSIIDTNLTQNVPADITPPNSEV